MKIHFYKIVKNERKRTTITLSDALVDAWCAVFPDKKLSEFLSNVTIGKHKTFQRAAEEAILHSILDNLGAQQRKQK